MNSSQRVTFSPGEFAMLFGKSQTWGYRQIYAGKVKAITEFGRILIPAAEVEKILGSAARYEGRRATPPKTKADFQKLGPVLKSGWQDFLQKRRASRADTAKPGKAVLKPAPKWNGSKTTRKDAIGRLARRG